MNNIPIAQVTEGLIVATKHPHKGMYTEAPHEENRVAWRVTKITRNGRVSVHKERVMCKNGSFILCPDRKFGFKVPNFRYHLF